MENLEALAIMRSLASGIDPDSAKALEPESICRRPLVIKALNRALGALLRLEQREQDLPAQAGRYWSHEEDAQVCAEVRRGMDFQEIAKSHNRTIPSIVARLVKLGEIRPASGRPSAPRRGASLNLETDLFPL